MVPLLLLYLNDPRHGLNRPALIPNVTPILDISRKSSMCISLVLDTLKIYNIKTSNEYYIQQMHSYNKLQLNFLKSVICILEHPCHAAAGTNEHLLKHPSGY
jgi:hypothetical protein